MKHPTTRIVEAQTEPYASAFQALLCEYASILGAPNVGIGTLASEIDPLTAEHGRPSGRLFLALSHEAPVGICALGPCPDAMASNAAEMNSLYVRPQYRRQGAGRDLTEMAIEAAKAEGYEFLLLDTLDDMEAARGMYAEMGFVEIAPYLHDPSERAHYLQLTL
jgi:ribosomal protein S18 acetylase RimI-like enzyme